MHKTIHKNTEHTKQKAKYKKTKNKYKTDNKNIKRVIITKNKRHEANNSNITYYSETHMQRA
jgi:hypothetical protein